MPTLLHENISSLLAPWSFDAKKWHRNLQKYLKCNSAGIGIINLAHPNQDELFAMVGWQPKALQRWLAGNTDHLRRTAATEGVSVVAPGQKRSSPLLSSGHAVVCMIPSDQERKSYWWMMLARDKSAFSQVEQTKAQHLLGRFHHRFLMPHEAHLGRLLIGHDDRLITADYDFKDRFLDKPSLYNDFLTMFHRVVEQRYPKLKDFDTHDFAVSIGKESFWLCFTRRRAIRTADTYHWYIELRPLGEDEIPVVDTLKDDRIARALSYVHDHYAEVPSLATLAEHTGMSPFHFHRLFSHQVGTSPKQYQLRKQMQMAKWILRAHRIPIGETADRTGFSSHGHFTSTFQRMIGMSPTQYRESFY